MSIDGFEAKLCSVQFQLKLRTTALSVAVVDATVWCRSQVRNIFCRVCQIDDISGKKQDFLRACRCVEVFCLKRAQSKSYIAVHLGHDWRIPTVPKTFDEYNWTRCGSGDTTLWWKEPLLVSCMDYDAVNKQHRRVTIQGCAVVTVIIMPPEPFYQFRPNSIIVLTFSSKNAKKIKRDGGSSTHAGGPLLSLSLPRLRLRLLLLLRLRSLPRLSLSASTHRQHHT